MKMRNIRGAFYAILAIINVVGGAVLYAAQVQAAPPAGETVPEEKIKDMTATLVVQDLDRGELGKIGGSFNTTYSLKRMSVAYQYPNKARFEAKVLGASLLMVYNGDNKMFRVPGQTKKLNIYGQPGQKQTLMDLGIFGKDYLTTDYNPIYQRTEKGLEVYKLAMRNTENKSHEIVWVNPKTAIIEKRLSYNGDNKLIKEMRYLNALQIRPGIWVPSRIEIYNTEGKLGVSQSIEDVKVNLGVNPDQFNVS